MNQSTHDSWWHERDTRPSHLAEARREVRLYPRRNGGEVWIRGLLVVGVMMALILTIINAVAR